MYLQEETYAAASSFVLGYDIAVQGGALVGFQEWLIVRVDDGNNLAWTALVLRLVFPGTPDPEKLLHSTTARQREAIEGLFRTIAEFDDDRAAPEGLRKIYVEYERWLRKQDWYAPGKPSWIA